MQTKMIRLTDWIYAIDQQMVRAYVLVGKRQVLCLDTGAAPADLPGIIRKITDLPVQVCLTHSDRDHVANLKQFDQAYAHSEELPYLEAFSSVHFQPLKEGDYLDLGGKRLLVLHCPGHTPGSIALLDEEDKILFSGDTVSLGPVYMFGPNRQPSVYLETLKRLWAMAEEGKFSLVYPHHNTVPIPGEKIRNLIDCMEGILQGTLTGEPAGLAMPGGETVKLYRNGDCGIYYDPSDPLV